jgi:hypothetical protein
MDKAWGLEKRRRATDTLYSAAVFDLDAGPVTITLPDAGTRFMSLQVINEDQYTYGVFYKPGNYTLTREDVGTRYVVAAVRTLVDPNDPKDVSTVHELQDAIRSSQGSTGKFEIPNRDQASQKKVRDALLVLASTLPDTNRMYGRKEEVDPVRFVIGAAQGWGANPLAKRCTSTSCQPRTTEAPSTNSRWETFPWTVFGRLASTTPKAISSRTP